MTIDIQRHNCTRRGAVIAGVSLAFVAGLSVPRPVHYAPLSYCQLQAMAIAEWEGGPAMTPAQGRRLVMLADQLPGGASVAGTDADGCAY